MCHEGKFEFMTRSNCKIVFFNKQIENRCISYGEGRKTGTKGQFVIIS